MSEWDTEEEALRRGENREDIAGICENEGSPGGRELYIQALRYEAIGLAAQKPPCPAAPAAAGLRGKS